MTPAEMKTVRESLGLSSQWLADSLGVTLRQTRRWEDGQSPIREDVIALLHRLEAVMEELVDHLLDQVTDKYGVASVEDLDDVRRDDIDWPTVKVPRIDADSWAVDEVVLPASFHRAVAARLRWELAGQVWIEYV